MKELLHQNIIEQAHGMVFLNRLFEVSKWYSTDLRLLLDLNMSVAQVSLVLSNGCALVSVDLKDTYWHFGLNIAPSLYKASTASEEAPLQRECPSVKVPGRLVNYW